MVSDVIKVQGEMRDQLKVMKKDGSDSKNNKDNHMRLTKKR